MTTQRSKCRQKIRASFWPPSTRFCPLSRPQRIPCSEIFLSSNFARATLMILQPLGRSRAQIAVILFASFRVCRAQIEQISRSNKQKGIVDTSRSLSSRTGTTILVCHWSRYFNGGQMSFLPPSVVSRTQESLGLELPGHVGLLLPMRVTIACAG